MRTLITALTLSLIACAGQITGGPGDDDTNPSCGDGTVDQGEQCDDGNAVDGDGCSSTCTFESSQARITPTVDVATFTVDLGKSQMITLTLASEAGPDEAVTIAPSLVDGTNVPIAGIVLAGPTSLNVPANGSITGAYTLTIPSNLSGTQLTGNLKFDVTTAAGVKSVSSAATITNIYTVTYAVTADTNVATHPIGSGAQSANVTVKRGTLIRFKNDATIVHVTHGGGAFPHEDIGTGGQPGATYEVNTVGTAPGSTGELGCHNHGMDYVNFTVE